MTTTGNATENIEVSSPASLNNNPINNMLDHNIYAKWKIDGLHKMKEKARHNVSHRSKKIKNIVNEIVSAWTNNVSPFSINHEFEELALHQLFTKFESWTGVNINACKNGIVDWNEYWDRADNWFNRNKGQWFGDYYFCSIFDTHLTQYCDTVSNAIYPNDIQKKQCFYSLLYVEILRRISSENIRFKQTRPQSLVIDQSLIQSNLLQNFLLKFSISNGIIWTLPKTKSAKLYRESWRECIDKIYKQTHALYCLISGFNKNRVNLNTKQSLYTSVTNNAPQQRVFTPISCIQPPQQQQQQPVTYYIVPIGSISGVNYGALHNSNQYSATQRYHPYSSTNIETFHLNNNNNNNNIGYLVNALNPFNFMQ